jgi:cyclohexanecarboxylate-CoA ligase
VAHPNGDLGLPRLHERLRHWARVRPSHPAVKSTTGVLTFAQMRDAVDAAADTLQRSGVSAGGVVAFQLPNWTDAFVLYHAILSIDAIALPLLPALRDRDLAYMLRETQACLFITPVVWRGHDHQAMARRVCSTQVRVAVVRAPHEDLPLLHDWSWGQAEVHQPALVSPASRGGAPGSPTAVCSMIFTSGTSGRPKAVLYSHQCLAFEGRDMAGVDCVEAEDVLFVPSSIGHVSGLSFGIYLPMHVGATVCLLAEWNAAQAVEFIERTQCTWTAGATPFLQGIVAEAAVRPSALASLRAFRCGGASVPPGLVRQARALGIDAYRSYGMSEHPTVSGHAGQSELVCTTTDGTLHPLIEVRIVDPDDASRVLEPGAEGEILTLGPDRSVGYLRVSDSEGSAVDGWIRTGDLGSLSPDRVLTVTGRKKDIIIRKGEKISAKEIEDLLADHPSIGDVAVVGVADTERGELVCCVAVGKGGALPTLSGLCDYLRAQGLAAFKLPERLVLLDELPYNPGGKVLKPVLRAMLAGDQGAGVPDDHFAGHKEVGGLLPSQLIQYAVDEAHRRVIE